MMVWLPILLLFLLTSQSCEGKKKKKNGGGDFSMASLLSGMDVNEQQMFKEELEKEVKKFHVPGSHAHKSSSKRSKVKVKAKKKEPAEPKALVGICDPICAHQCVHGCDFRCCVPGYQQAKRIPRPPPGVSLPGACSTSCSPTCYPECSHTCCAGGMYQSAAQPPPQQCSLDCAVNCHVGCAPICCKKYNPYQAPALPPRPAVLPQQNYYLSPPVPQQRPFLPLPPPVALAVAPPLPVRPMVGYSSAFSPPPITQPLPVSDRPVVMPQPAVQVVAPPQSLLLPPRPVPVANLPLPGLPVSRPVLPQGPCMAACRSVCAPSCPQECCPPATVRSIGTAMLRQQLSNSKPNIVPAALQTTQLRGVAENKPLTPQQSFPVIGIARLQQCPAPCSSRCAPGCKEVCCNPPLRSIHTNDKKSKIAKQLALLKK